VSAAASRLGIGDDNGPLGLPAIGESGSDIIGRADLGVPENLSREDADAITRHSQGSREIVRQAHGVRS
jgi:hypothetical protein